MRCRKPRAFRNTRTSPMAAGAMWIAPLSRKNSVPRTTPSWASRRSWARSSKPGASGTGGVLGLEDVDRGGRPVGALGLEAIDVLGQQLDRALRAVARAPAQRRVGMDHRAKLEDPVHERLGARRA